ncbi:repressor LexA [Candidatus Kaiserbacteria bacterium]|nr:MAG: repressor LexA [Candidatus Kaiserbacteria bacterium]
MNLTKKQNEVLVYIRTHTQEKGYSPTLDEIRKKFKLASVSTAHYYVERLKDAGYLTKEVGLARAIEITVDDFQNGLIPSPMVADSIAIPIVGAANCGAASLLAEGDVEGYVKVTRSLLRRRDNVFAVQAEGDSMNLASIDGKNIEEGDYVLIDFQNIDPKDGDYVLSVIDGCANLKKFYQDPKSGAIALIPESDNAEHKPIFISSEDDFMINGKIIAVVKK